MKDLHIEILVTGTVGLNYGIDGTTEVKKGQMLECKTESQLKIASIWVKQGIAKFVELESEDDPVEVESEDEQVDHQMSIEEALLNLDPENDDHWTQVGLPSMKAIEELVGDEKIKRKDVVEAYPGFDREKALELVTQ